MHWVDSRNQQQQQQVEKPDQSLGNNLKLFNGPTNHPHSPRSSSRCGWWLPFQPCRQGSGVCVCRRLRLERTDCSALWSHKAEQSALCREFILVEQISPFLVKLLSWACAVNQQRAGICQRVGVACENRDKAHLRWWSLVEMGYFVLISNSFKGRGRKMNN